MVVTAIRREFEKLDSLQVVAMASTQPSASDPTSNQDPVHDKLAALSKEELQQLLDSDVAMERFMASLAFPALETMVANIANMREVVRVTAETNIQLETEIEMTRDALLCKVEEYHTKKLSLGQVCSSRSLNPLLRPWQG